MCCLPNFIRPRKEAQEDVNIGRLASAKRKAINSATEVTSSMAHIVLHARKSPTFMAALEWEFRRAVLLLRMFASLDSTQRACLSALLISKAKVT